jgi:hypothetical protein
MIAKRSILTLFLVLSASSALAEDGFVAIHADNQKVGSAVSEFWSNYATEPAQPPQDGFMEIHMANQKIGSAVANFWLLQSKYDCAVTPPPDSIR